MSEVTSATNQNPDECIAWVQLQYTYPKYSVVKGPYTNTDHDKTLICNEISMALGKNEGYFDKVGVNPIFEAKEDKGLLECNWHPNLTVQYIREYNEEVADAMRAVTTKPIDVYVVRQLKVEVGKEPISKLKANWTNEVTRNVLSGGRHIGLVVQPVAFLDELEAHNHAREVLLANQAWPHDELVEMPREHAWTETMEQDVLAKMLFGEDSTLKVLVTVTSLSVSKAMRGPEEHPWIGASGK
jgi:hypothetical protein